MGKEEMNFSFLKKINLKNLDLALVKLEKCMSAFSKGVRAFNDSMDKVTKEFSNDVERSRIVSNDRERINKHHMKKLYGESKHNSIWSNEKNNETLF